VEVGEAGVVARVRLDLSRELARGCEHERPQASGAPEEAREDGKHERRRLSGPGLRGADQILALENDRDGFALDKTGNLYVGAYKNFVTPNFKGQVVYFPTDSHIGVSFLLEQAIGDYHAMNARLGLPVVLINKKAEPAINFECQVRLYDLGHSIDAGKGLSGRTAVGLTVGVPFSKSAY